MFAISNNFDKSPLERITNFSRKISTSFTRSMMMLDLICEPELDVKVPGPDIHNRVFGEMLYYDEEGEKKAEADRK